MLTRKRSKLRLQPRDQKLLVDLYGYGCMLRSQIQTLYFGSVQRTNARLLQLYEAGYVERAELPIPVEAGAQNGCQFAYLLGSKGIPIVAAATGLDPAYIRQLQRKGTPSYLLHTIEIVSFRLAVERAVRGNSCIELLSFLPERLCRHAYKYRAAEEGENSEGWRLEVYKPDAILLLSYLKDRRGYAVEIDLGHTNSQEFLTKLQIHARYAKTPELFEQRYAMPKRATLVLTTGALRRSNLLSIARKVEGYLVYIATYEDVRNYGAFSSIWHSSLDGIPYSILS